MINKNGTRKEAHDLDISVTQMLCSSKPNHGGGDRLTFQVRTSTLSPGTFVSLLSMFCFCFADSSDI